MCCKITAKFSFSLTHSWRKSLSYRNSSTDLHSKSIDWFLYDTDLRLGNVKGPEQLQKGLIV